MSVDINVRLHSDHDLQRMNTERVKQLRETAVFERNDSDRPPSFNMKAKHIQKTFEMLTLDSLH